MRKTKAEATDKVSARNVQTDINTSNQPQEAGQLAGLRLAERIAAMEYKKVTSATVVDRSQDKFLNGAMVASSEILSLIRKEIAELATDGPLLGEVHVVRYLAEAAVFSKKEIADAFAREQAKTQKGTWLEPVQETAIDEKAGWVARLLYWQGIDLRTGELYAPRKQLWMGPPERPAWWEACRSEGLVNHIVGYSSVSAEEALQQALDGREAYLREQEAV